MGRVLTTTLRMSGEDSIAKLLFMWGVSLGGAMALAVSFFRWRRPPRDTRAFAWRGLVALVEIVGAGLAVVLTVGLDGYFAETWSWLRVLVELDAFKALTALMFGAAGGIVVPFIDPPRWWPGGSATKAQTGP